MFDLGGYSLAAMAVIALGSFAGGLVNGLTGFGTALSALPIWLQAVPPATAAQLGAVGGVAGQLITFPSIWHAIDWRHLAPMLVAGLLGVPIGAALLPSIDVGNFKLGIGLILVTYAGVMLATRQRLRLAPRGRGADVVVGFIGGVMGGLAGISGAALTVWAALQGWGKERRRGVFQAFNFTILSGMLLAHAIGGMISPLFLTALLLALPGTFLGVAIGQRLYARLDDRGFDKAVLLLLGAAGVVQVLTSR